MFYFRPLHIICLNTCRLSNRLNFQAIDTSDYCLAHLFTIRNLGCVVGLANVGTVCSSFANTGFTTLNPTKVYLHYKFSISLFYLKQNAAWRLVDSLLYIWAIIHLHVKPL